MKRLSPAIRVVFLGVLVLLLVTPPSPREFAGFGTQEAAAQSTFQCWTQERNRCVSQRRRSCLDRCGDPEDCETSMCRNNRHGCRNRCNDRYTYCDNTLACAHEAARACGGFPANMHRLGCQ